MNICFLAHAASIHTRRWLYFFRDQGHHVSVITLTPTDALRGIDTYILYHNQTIRYEQANWHYLLKLPLLYKKVRDIQPDIINSHFLSSYGFLGALVKPPNIPYVVSLHGSDILVFPKRSPLHYWVTRLALKNANMITSVAHHMTKELVKYGASHKSILTIQYGVDTEMFFPPSSPTSREPVCISNRAMVPTSNLNTVLLAASKLKDYAAYIHFHMIGEGELFATLRRQAQELNMENHVSFLGKVAHTKMPELLRKSAIYVSMTTSDGTSLSLLEAMACGTFPIVSNIPANQEWIKDGVNGYLVPPNSPRQLAQKIKSALQQPELRQAAAEYNWSLIQEKGDYQKNMSTIERAFEDLIAHQIQNPSG